MPRYRYRRWYRSGRMTAGQKGAAIAAGAVLLAGAGHAAAAVAHHHGIPDGSAYTPATWAAALLRDDGLPRTACDKGAITAWEHVEGGHWRNPAAYNPLDTTEAEPGSYAINPVGVQAYTSWHDGFAATITTLNNGRYPGIIAALQSGGSAQAVADAVASSPWGTSAFEVSC